MAETVFILGCGIMQIPALTIARDMGWYVAAADGNREAEGRHLCDHFFHVDLKDISGLTAAAGEIRNRWGLDAVFTAGTDFSLSAALVAEAYGLPGHSSKAALLATDKALMRQQFLEKGVPSPLFAEIGPDEDARNLLSGIPGPWVVKPVDSMGARGVVKIDNPDELSSSLEKARSFSFSGRALVETFMEGLEYSLDALVEDGRIIRCGLADRHIVYPPYFIETGHTVPSSLEPEAAECLWEVFVEGIKALGLTRGAAKGDIKITSKGPMVGEIAARLSGGYMSGWTYPLSSGIEPTRAALRLAAGLPSSITEKVKSLVCAEKALLGIDGTVLRLGGRNKALKLSGVKEVFLRYAPGDSLSFPRNNVEKAGNVIVTGADRAEAEKRALAALRALELILDPSDMATGSYLDAEGPFPPDAFELEGEGELCSFLNELWGAHAPLPSRGCSVKPLIISAPPVSSVRDYTGRSISDILKIFSDDGLIRICGVSSGENSVLLSDFWKALIRGGLPGGRWYLEHRG